jgi:alpha-L-fucosidase
MQTGPFGISVTYNPMTQTAGGPSIFRWDDRIDAFDAERLCDDIVAMGSKWLLFCLHHADFIFCTPNAYLESILPGRCSKRDLIMDLAKGCRQRGLKFIAYSHTEVDEWDKCVRGPLGWDLHPTDKSIYQLHYMAMVREWSLRYGDLIDAWWFDACYDSKMMAHMKTHEWDNSRFDIKAFAEAVRAGKPGVPFAMNNGVNDEKHEYCFPEEDYMAGEANKLTVRPTGPLQDGKQWHGYVWLDCFWAHQGLPKPIIPPRFSDDELFDYVNTCHRNGGGVTLNVGIYQNGSLAEETVEQIRRIAARL